MKIWQSNRKPNCAVFNVIMDGDREVMPGTNYIVEHGDYEKKVRFQDGMITKHNPPNGLTTEALLAILIHRTRKLNTVVPCDENIEAIKQMEKALYSFDKRTEDRVKRKVIGTKIR